MTSRPRRLAIAVAALSALGTAACRHAAPGGPPAPSLGDRPDSCDAVRERVRGSGFVLADTGPVERADNRQPPDLEPQDDAGKPVPPFVLSYLVTTAGRVDPSSIRTTGTLSPRVEASLVDAVRRWRFAPARYHGCTVAHLARDTFSFPPPRP